MFYGEYSMSIYWMCVFFKVLLSVLWRIFDEYWMCVFFKVLLSVLWRILGEYWM